MQNNHEMTPKAAVEIELTHLIQWAEQADFRNIAGAVRYVLTVVSESLDNKHPADLS
jgi:hypothetical protein